MVDCVASENSWRLSENFERNCKERYPQLLDDDIDISFEMNSVDSCKACDFLSSQQNDDPDKKNSKKPLVPKLYD